MNEFLNDLRKKYGYDNDLIKAIEITINLMLEKYGEDQKSEIYSLFDSTEIFSLREINRETVNEIEEKNRVYNPHIRFAESKNPYGSFGASMYMFEPIFDINMKIIGETKFIIIEDMKGKENEEGYRKLFGTSINMPYFIHEANHAYAMMHPEITYDGDTLFSKHGMCSSTFHYTKDYDGKYTVHQEKSNDVILEEMINEKITQDMLSSFFKVDNYQEACDLLRGINHQGTEYSCNLIDLGKKLEALLGADGLMDYRRNNNHSYIEKFNEVAGKGEVALEYLDGEVPFNYFRNKAFELFTLDAHKDKMEPKDHIYEAAKILLDAFAPLIAYEEVEFKTKNLVDFNKIRDSVLSQYPQYKGNGFVA